jgi:hypothetical protein
MYLVTPGDIDRSRYSLASVRRPEVWYMIQSLRAPSAAWFLQLEV